MSPRTFGTVLTHRRWRGTNSCPVPAPDPAGCRIPSLAMPTQIVVAGAVIWGSAVLVAQRARPPELAGRWELPGGKGAPGETERDALARELAEELGLEVSDVAVGDRL